MGRLCHLSSSSMHLLMLMLDLYLLSHNHWYLLSSWMSSFAAWARGWEATDRSAWIRPKSWHPGISRPRSRHNGRLPYYQGRHLQMRYLLTISVLSINRSNWLKDPINQLMSQLLVKLMDHSINRSIDWSISIPISHLISQWLKPACKKSVSCFWWWISGWIFGWLIYQMDWMPWWNWS